MPSKAKSKPVKAAKKPAPKKSAPAKKPAPKKPAAKKPARPAAKQPAPKKPSSAKSAPKAAKPAPKSKVKAVIKKKSVPAAASPSVRRTRGKETLRPGTATVRTAGRPQAIEKWTPPPEIARSVFNKKQRSRLLDLKDSLMDSVSGMAADQLRARSEDGGSSAFGMHQADAGSDAYDRDFALSLLSKEQDALYEIEEALKRLDSGNYGVCEMCNKTIPQSRLEALPFARFTVDCQGEYEREVISGNGRRPVRSLFGLMGDEDEEEEAEEKETVDKSED